ncbi:hypothetical protein J7E93_29675 [Streptomyces sp. ISL-36]|uniref:hypothetical protein n=1 Tax=Streptomyces sp. ISL-36 TaxID=2819182 RepID=UPI001BE750EF|nr:hypothetical protein [Streptomyces sp. ISL-36]MBT2444188.1 hypothetical protein [Streptomyces sp. ISL-36]
MELLRRLRSPRLIRLYETLTVDDPALPELDGATVLVLEKAERPLPALLSGAAPPPAGPALLVQVCEGLRQRTSAAAGSCPDPRNAGTGGPPAPGRYRRAARCPPLGGRSGA